jgi:CO/xanthine dehydrogenase Mo-binding subunit
MRPLFLSMQAIAAKRGDGLRPELLDLPSEAGACRSFGPEIDEHISALQCASDATPAMSLSHLDVEFTGPGSLLPYGHKCRLHFDASGTVILTIGIRDYGRGYASPYFASLVVARLGIPPTRVRLYYAGNLPAAKVEFRDLQAVPDRESVGCRNAQIGELIEKLCKAAIEIGRRNFAAAVGGRVHDIRFRAESGLFLGPDGRCCAHILELAKAACDGRQGLEFLCRAM